MAVSAPEATEYFATPPRPGSDLIFGRLDRLFARFPTGAVEGLPAILHATTYPVTTEQGDVCVEVD
jgi:hypothetical protein